MQNNVTLRRVSDNNQFDFEHINDARKTILEYPTETFTIAAFGTHIYEYAKNQPIVKHDGKTIELDFSVFYGRKSN